MKPALRCLQVLAIRNIKGKFSYASFCEIQVQFLISLLLREKKAFHLLLILDEEKYALLTQCWKHP